MAWSKIAVAVFVLQLLAVSALPRGKRGVTSAPTEEAVEEIMSVPTAEPTHEPSSATLFPTMAGMNETVAMQQNLGMSLPLARFVLDCALACLLKITTSVDDLLWFSPFLTLCQSRAEKIRCCLVYFCVCVFVTVGAIAIAEGATIGMTFLISDSSEGFWNSERVLAVISGSSIMAYGIYELQDWLKERSMWSLYTLAAYFKRGKDRQPATYIAVQPGEKNALSAQDVAVDLGASTAIQAEDEDDPVGHSVDVEAPLTHEPIITSSIEDPASEEDDSPQKKIEEARKSSYRLFVVALCGTLDDLTMFAVVILGHSISFLEVAIGAFFATMFIMFLCWQMAAYKPFADCIHKVPMWAMLCVLATYILLGGLIQI